MATPQPENSTPPSAARGRLELIVGCMFAGKTSGLIDRLEAARTAGLRAAAFKHHLDARYNAIELATHDGRHFPAVPVRDAAELETKAAECDVIGIDEVQFFGPPIVAVCERFLAAGKQLIAVGIDYNVRGRPFEPFPALKALATEITEMHTPCDVCGRPARYSQRLTPVINGNWVGGRDAYAPRCADCFEPYEGSLVP